MTGRGPLGRQAGGDDEEADMRRGGQGRLWALGTRGFLRGGWGEADGERPTGRGGQAQANGKLGVDGVVHAL